MSAMKPYPQYKESGIEWLEKIPASWEVAPLWSLFRRSKTLGSGSEELLSVYRDYGVIPKASRDDNFNKASEDLSKYQVVEQGDLVINKMKAWQGSVAMSEFDGIVSPAYFVFKRIGTMNTRFMHYLMRSVTYFQHYASISTGVRPNQWDLDPAKHRIMPVLLPPLIDQQAIATYLDREIAHINAFINDQETLVGLLKERRLATISHAVTKGIDPAVAVKSSEIEWLGEVPQHWQIHGLKHVATTVAGAGFPHEHQGSTDEKYAFHKVNALSTADADGVIRTRRETVSADTAKVLRAEILPAGSIILAKIGAALLLGRIRMLGASSCIDNNLLGVKVAPGTHPRFVFYALHLVDFPRIVNPGTIPSLSEKSFRSFDLAWPSYEEQEAIADFLDRETAEIDSAIVDAQEAIKLSQERRAALISAAVTGKIDVRDWSRSKERALESHGVA